MNSDLVMVVGVNVWAWGFAYLMKRWCPRFGQDTILGYYLVLMPIGFFAWSRPELWFVAACAMLGLLLITRSVQKIVTSAYNLPLQPTSAPRG